MALDCGFTFHFSWKKAIPHMVQPSGAALIFTKLNKKDYLDIVQKENDGGNLQIVNPPQRDPFQSLRLVRCSDKNGNYEPHSVIYTNNFISYFMIWILLLLNICDKWLLDIPLI